MAPAFASVFLLRKNTRCTPNASSDTGLPEESSDQGGTLALCLGNPSNATADVSNTENYLLKKSTYAVSYNNSTLNPN